MANLTNQTTNKNEFIEFSEDCDSKSHISPLCKIQNYGPKNPSFNNVLNKSYMTDVINHLVRAHEAQQEVS